MSEGTNRRTILWVLGVAFVALAGVGIASWLKEKQKGEALAESRRENCFKAVKKTSRYPSKAVFTDTVDLVGAGVSGRVEFMNGFGAMIPHTYACNFDSLSSTFVKGIPLVSEGD